MAATYLLLLPVKSFAIGDLWPAEVPLPLHCTILPWFCLPEEYSLLDIEAKVSETVMSLGVEAVSLSISHREFFGAHADIPVYVLHRNAAICNLHKSLLLSMERAGAQTRDAQYCGEQYSPHITEISAEQLFPQYVAREIVIIRQSTDMITNKVVARIAFPKH